MVNGSGRGSRRSLEGWLFASTLIALGYSVLSGRGSRQRTSRAVNRPYGSNPEPDRQAAGLASPDRHPVEDRGRHASTPRDIPRKGWRDILLRVYNEINQDRVLAVAAGVAFYGLLAIFPTIAAFISLYGLLADPATVSEHLESLQTVLPGGAIEIIGEQLQRITSQSDGSLGFSFFLGLAIALWSANAGTKAIFDALNVVYDEDEKRNFFVLNALSLLFTLSGIVLIIVGLGAMIGLPLLLERIGLGSGTEMALNLLRWPLLYIVFTIAIAVVYRYGPSRKRAKWRWITWGSLLAGLLWLAASALFSWYVANFASYNKTYGSLGAVVGLMIWMWISTIVILVCAELNAEMEHQTARDTTTPPRRPMGERGAVMADTIGHAS